MKKNKMMRLASLVLVGVLMTASAVSGTFAKYVSAGSGTDKARVAKWGVEVTATGEAFAKTYAKDDSSFTLAANTVVSTDKVVAPGTSGSLAAISLTGTPEVATRLTYKLDKLDLTNWMVDTDEDGTADAFYCPLVFKIGSTVIAGSTCADANAIKTAIDAALATYTKDYVAGTDLSSIATTDFPEVTWEWPFVTGTTATEIAANDVKDTFLGDQAAAGNAATVEITLTCTATQID